MRDLENRGTIVLTVDVLGFVGGKITSGKFTVGGFGSTITAWQIVDDQSGDLIARNVLQVLLNDTDTGTGVATNALVE